MANEPIAFGPLAWSEIHITLDNKIRYTSELARLRRHFSTEPSHLSGSTLQHPSNILSKHSILENFELLETLATE